MTSAASLVAAHRHQWAEATWGPFLEGVHDGSLPQTAFESWLQQDYLFVADLLGFQARVLAMAPRADQAVIASGLVAMEGELSWFESKLRTGSEGPGQPQPATVAYRRHLARLAAAPYPSAIVSLWALERAYLEAWRGAAPAAPRFQEFVDHWTTHEFVDYVARLERAADYSLAAASESERTDAEAAFVATLALEAEFWRMVMSAG